MAPKVLFLLKQRKNSWSYETTTEIQPTGVVSTNFSSGLYNSARFVVDMLTKQGLEASLDHCIDGDFIDRLVTIKKPDFVILEAYWVTPSKIEILCKLHPKITWIIRNHSRMPFMACEGLIIDWSVRYVKNPKVFIASNTQNTSSEIRYIFQASGLNKSESLSRSIYLPNYYSPKGATLSKHYERIKHHILLNKVKEDKIINIGCFGAIRPLKNQLLQAVAAIKFAELNNLQLFFHINGGRVETKGDEPLKNMRLMFQSMTRHKLVEYDWMEHDTFLAVLRQMDILMQVSFTETFNIVTADAINEGIPVLVSPEIFWVDETAHVDPTSSESMINRLETISRMTVMNFQIELMKHRTKLIDYSQKSIRQWTKTLGIPFKFDESSEEDITPIFPHFTGPVRTKRVSSKNGV